MRRGSSLKHMLQRVAARPVRHLLSIHVDSVRLPGPIDGVDEGSELSVCFERGGKMASSLDQTPEFEEPGSGRVSECDSGSGRGRVSECGSGSGSGSGCVIRFHNQELRLVVTLYQQNDKKIGKVKFQEKIGSLVVRRKCVSGGRAAVQFKGVGVVQLDLAAIAEATASGIVIGAQSREEVLQKCTVSGAVIVFRVEASLLDKEVAFGDENEEVDANFDDTMSQQSGFSDTTLGAADFSVRVDRSSIINECISQPQSIREQGVGSKVDAISMSSKVEDCDEVDSFLVSTRHSDLMISYESSKVLSQQLEESQRHSQQEVDRTAELQRDLSRLESENTLRKADLVQLQALVEGSSELKDKEVTALTAENIRLREALKVAEATSTDVIVPNTLQEYSNAEIRKLESELIIMRERDAERLHAISILQATKNFTEGQLTEKIEETAVLRRRLQMYAETVAAMELTAAGKNDVRSVSVSRNTALSMRRQETSVSPTASHTFSGILTKRGSFYPSWKKRYFELEGRTLNYYTSSESMEWKGNFRIMASTQLCPAAIIDDRVLGFYLQNKNKRLYLEAANEYDRDKWASALRHCIEEAED